MFRFASAVLVMFLTGCSDNAVVTIYDNSISNKKITCMSLRVFPSDEMIERTLKNSYLFDESCPVRLEVNSKANIYCNSNQNAPSKALGAMPNSYLRMEISQENKKLYSYYIDIKGEIEESHIEDAFLRIEKDFIIVR